MLIIAVTNLLPQLALKGRRANVRGVIEVIFHVQVLFQLLVLLCLGKELVQSGWTGCSATVQRGGWRSVATMAGGTPPATIPMMPLWSVKVLLTVESGNETTTQPGIKH